MTFNDIAYWLSAWTLVSVGAGLAFGLIMQHQGHDRDAPELPEPRA